MKRFWLLIVVLALPATALAQQPGGETAGLYRKWDAGGGMGIRFGAKDDVVVPLGAWSAGVSRYWTAHVKTSVDVMTAGQETYVGSSYDGRSSRYTSSVTGPAALSATAGYQFFDNAFVHPYIAGGVRVASAFERTRITSSTFPYASSTVTKPATLAARPVLGGGFKSYFDNGRAFMKSELLMAVGPHGSAHAVLTIGAGIDF